MDYALQEHWDKMTDILSDPDKQAQSALTNYQRLATTELPYPVGRYETARYSLVALEPKTGRKHQLRRHMKHIFHPIVGDTTHGDGKQNAFLREQFGLSRLLLHAERLSFTHPVTTAPLTIVAPLPEDFKGVISQIGLAV